MEFQGTQGDLKIGIAFQVETENIKIKTDGQLLVIEDENGKAVAIIGRIGEPEQEANAKLLVQSKKMFKMLKQAKTTICRLRLSMSAHPDCEENSEFADYVDLADEKEKQIKELLTKITE